MNIDINENWDAIIIGTGIAGSTIGYSLASKGKKVLFCEQGKTHLNSIDAIKDQFPEAAHSKHKNQLADLKNAGRWSNPIADKSKTKTKWSLPLLGVGTGGSSALYGMVFDRPSQDELQLKRKTHPKSSDTVWPIPFDELSPYFEKAEILYATQFPKKLTPTSFELFKFFQNKKLNPSQLRLACDFHPECKTCQGFLCGKSCKNDGAKVCLTPAISSYGAKILTECRVIKLESTQTKIQSVVCEFNGEIIKLKANIVILAAGALETPRILCRSSNDDWPNGLANSTHLIGKNLMRHYVDLYFVFTKNNPKNELATKQIGLKHDEINLQSFGNIPDGKVLVAEINKNLELNNHAVLKFLFKLIAPFFLIITKIVLKRATVLATILEDIPYEENYVYTDSEHIAENHVSIHYSISKEEQDRINKSREKVREMLKPYYFLSSLQAENNTRLAHACGTCRMGIDPKTSVVDKNNKAHELTNLYIVDSSFFPSSTNANPTLLIAANALRVADHILKTEL